MTKITSMLIAILATPRSALIVLSAIAAAALGTALISQYLFGLAPCELCIWQRWPYAFVIVIGLAGFFLSPKAPCRGKGFLALSALGFLSTAGIAVYHTGVERKWWKSFLEGCHTPSLEGSITDVLARIQAAPIARCDEIPWTDPVLGWSMANYNAIAGFAFAGLALYSLWLSRRGS